MILPVIIFYFVFGIIELKIKYKKGVNKEIYLYIILYLILIIFSFLIYFEIISRNFYKVLEEIVNLFK